MHEKQEPPATPEKLYLIIDDFSSAASEDMLRFLMQKDIQPVIFCIGKALENHMELAVKALTQGCIFELMCNNISKYLFMLKQVPNLLVVFR
ncbi:hypothetical protein [Pontibacter pamirensis]|uniref:hypothetical protein n=1 Tax=Pontibacter pamirensis TaxID=2562824 RepID=UPI00138A0DE0|nr:hypothetical protein [Pontibacter pamirensis]